MSGDLVASFVERLLGDLVDGSMLRGAWAEQVVAHYLGSTDLGGAWSYFDLRDSGGNTISVKHSVGPSPRFSVEMKKYAWDAEVGDWRPGDGTLEYRCAAYVFAWLPHSRPSREQLLEPSEWRFAVLSRHEMRRRFVAPDGAGQRTASASSIGDFVSGDRLTDLIALAVSETTD